MLEPSNYNALRSKSEPLCLPLEYFLGVCVKARGGGKPETGNECVPKFGGGVGTGNERQDGIHHTAKDTYSCFANRSSLEALPWKGRDSEVWLAPGALTLYEHEQVMVLAAVAEGPKEGKECDGQGAAA